MVQKQEEMLARNLILMFLFYYDVVFGILVESRTFWNSSLAKAMPIHWNIDREGIILR